MGRAAALLGGVLRADGAVPDSPRRSDRARVIERRVIATATVRRDLAGGGLSHFAVSGR